MVVVGLRQGFFFCVALVVPGTHSVEHAGLELKRCLPLSESRIKGGMGYRKSAPRLLTSTLLKNLLMTVFNGLWIAKARSKPLWSQIDSFNFSSPHTCTRLINTFIPTQ